MLVAVSTYAEVLAPPELTEEAGTRVKGVQGPALFPAITANIDLSVPSIEIQSRSIDGHLTAAQIWVVLPRRSPAWFQGPRLDIK